MPNNIEDFFNYYDHKVSIKKTKIARTDLPLITWYVSNKDLNYQIFDIPHVNKYQFNGWLSTLKLESDKSISYILLFRSLNPLNKNDQEIKIKQIKEIVKKIKESNGSVVHLSMGGYDNKNLPFSSVSVDILKELQIKNIYNDIDKIYVDQKTIETIYETLQQNKFMMSDYKKNKNIYDKINKIYIICCRKITYLKKIIYIFFRKDLIPLCMPLQE